MKRFKDFVAHPTFSRGEPWKGRCFYDDDVLYLLSGRSPPDSSIGLVCGLLAACGEVSSSSSSGGSIVRESEATIGDLGLVKLKRSACDAIKLLFYLVFEAVLDDGDAKEGDNVFLETFVNLGENDIDMMCLSAHVADDRDGDKVRQFLFLVLLPFLSRLRLFAHPPRSSLIPLPSAVSFWLQLARLRFDSLVAQPQKEWVRWRWRRCRP